MTVETPPARDNPGCLAPLLSVGLAALLLTLTVFPPAFATWTIYFPIFAVTGLIATVIGLPLYLAAAHFQRDNLWTALGGGALTGAALPLIGLLADTRQEQWLAVAGFAAAGLAGGLVFYLVATFPRAPMRNAALLFATATISVAAALLV